MKPYELFNYKYTDVTLKEGIAPDWDDIDECRLIPAPDPKKDAISDCLRFVVLRHLGFDAPQADISRALQVGAECANDFYFGDWMRDRFAGYFDHTSEWRDSCDWLEPYWAGLLFGFLMNDHALVQRLVAWIDHDLPHNNTIRDLEDGDSGFYKLFGYSLSGRIDVRLSDLQARIEAGRSVRAKMLVLSLQSIEAGDTAELAGRLEEYLTRHLKAEMKGRYVFDYISIEGSLLWHAARTRGLTIPGFAEKQQALIITRRTIGLE